MMLIAIVFAIAGSAQAICQNCATVDWVNWFCNGAGDGQPGAMQCTIWTENGYQACATSGESCTGTLCQCGIPEPGLCPGDPCERADCSQASKWQLASVSLQQGRTFYGFELVTSEFLRGVRRLEKLRPH